MDNRFHFTFDKLEQQITTAIECGYQFFTCEEFVRKKAEGTLPQQVLVNRVDIDFSCKKAKRLAQIFNRLNVKATFFVRLHAEEYNPFSFENFLCLKYIRDYGHEIGYHSEVIDQAVIWNEDATECLRRDIAVLNSMLEVNVRGVASHGGMTGLNNLDFWKDKKASDFDLLYEAYDTDSNFNLFNESLYISDSEWIRWKCFFRGKIREGDNRSLGEHVLDKYPLIYLLTHPDTYFDTHFYE